jgi:hypothetical protein
VTYGQTNCHTTRFDNQSKLKVVVDNLLSREITLTNVKTGSLGSKLDRNHVKIPQQGNTMPGNTSNNLNKKERVSDLITKFEFKKPNPGNGTKQENKGTGNGRKQEMFEKIDRKHDKIFICQEKGKVITGNENTTYRKDHQETGGGSSCRKFIFKYTRKQETCKKCNFLV